MPFQKTQPQAQTMAHAIGANETHTGTQASVGELTKARLVAVGFAGVMLFVVAFVTTPSVHNFAHDTRHTQSFPCH